jgi:hypothetical protein
MSTNKLQIIYQQSTELNYQEKLALISKLIADLQKPSERKKHKLSELQGLGKEMWIKIDTNQYLSDLRSEWDDR